ncbi:MAG: Crp/Fnr family transcriptional regulator [Chloroflexi bacterium]|nr:MAG: Crp/Fnr family transcriptional regulator [Chloroflexota bacterium]
MELSQDLFVENPVFAGLTRKEQIELMQEGIRKKYRAGDCVVHHDQVWSYLFLVVSGSIQGLKASTEGRSLIVLTLEDGELFWGMGFFEEDAGMPVSLQAHQDSEILMWSREQMMPWLMKNGRISWELARLMATRMRRASEIVEELAFQPVRGRLARLLLEHYGTAVDEFVSRDLSLDQMAAHIGTKREMVCRLLYQFAEEGAIEISRTEFMIADRGKLEIKALQAKG